jgi:serine/threonine protein kinase
LITTRQIFGNLKTNSNNNYDIFRSLGCLCIEIIEKSPPFAGNDPEIALKSILNSK